MPDGWKFYGIATADRPERQQHVLNELGRAHLDHTLHIAQRPPDAGGFSGIGVRGCFESHLACLKQARDEGVRVCVVAEDDIVIVRRLGSLLRTIDEELEGLEWSVLYLGYLTDWSPVYRQPVVPVTPHIVRSEGWEVTGSHFVAINGASLDAVIANFEERLLPGGHRIGVDAVLNEFRRDAPADTLLCVPNLGFQGPSPSGITDSSGIRTRLLHRPRIRHAVEIVKRVGWNVQSFVPVNLTIKRWNRRARAAHPSKEPS